MTASSTLSGLAPPKVAAPVMIQVADRRGHSRHRGRNVGIGIAAATAAAILLSQGARASGDGGGSHSYNCRRWDRRCDEGSEWACRKVRREC